MLRLPYRAWLLTIIAIGALAAPRLPEIAAADPAEKNRPSLGAQTRTPTDEEAKSCGLAKVKVGCIIGQYVSGVDQGGPAERAGLKIGDVLLALDANKLCSSDDVADFLRVSQPGAKVRVLVKRSGTLKEEGVTLTLAGSPAQPGQGFQWQYAGLGQLDAALASAKKENKLVLVGLSGANT